MHFDEGFLYHIYNRGNNRQPIFITEDNYYYFIRKMKEYITPRCDLFAWSLMPNHFHFLVHCHKLSVALAKSSLTSMQHLTDGIRLLLSSYTKGINKRYRRVGNLFQQKTKAKCVYNDTVNYAWTTMNYIHQNARRAKLVERIEDWKFCSFGEYLGNSNEILCNRSLAIKMLGIDMKNFYRDSHEGMPFEVGLIL